ncbi:hypothetical protein PUMCH_001422 [Australozyma saopauloensis]|uniref:DUF3533 domain-containing protein n=1 Tax=Australozyma saopauloensis TaxID=291208 RepID=A0AAX4H6G2_9ASCO|nr:hypothetical protein PUMCH_001422 [[Candida] saopauloensis]
MAQTLLLRVKNRFSHASPSNASPLAEPVPEQNQQPIDDTILPKTEPVSGARPPKREKKFSSLTAKEWSVIMYKLCRLYLVIFCMWLGLLSIYWGSVYRREKRAANLNMLVVIEDQIFTLQNGTIIPPVIGPLFVDLLSDGNGVGRFSIYYGRILEHFVPENTSIYDAVVDEVFTERYWAAFYINKTALKLVYDMIAGNDTLVNYTIALQDIISCIYELGRLYSALTQYVMKSLNRICLEWTETYAPAAYAQLLQSAFTPDQQMQIVQQTNSTEAPSALTWFPSINKIDLRPPSSSAVLGPSELGLVYAQLFSFHQFNFAADLHALLINELRFVDLLLYRFAFSQLNFLMLSLVYSLLTLAFKVSVTEAYGRGGFMVLWMTMYLFFSATGGSMEVLGTFVRYTGKIYLIAPAMIFLIVVNISPTFAAIELSPGVYRYGKGLPMYNTYEALKVVFFNTWRGNLGRNYGVLAAWIVFNTLLFTFLLHYIRKHPRNP